VLFVCGVTFPAITAAFRAWLPHRLTDEKDRTAAYSVLSVAFQAAMACGPVLVGACAAAAWPGAAVVGAAVLVAAGTVTFVTSRDLAQRGGRLVRAADSRGCGGLCPYCS
jgi:predicted MFS family arabinose efflux permease